MIARSNIKVKGKFEVPGVSSCHATKLLLLLLLLSQVQQVSVPAPSSAWHLLYKL
jgi:hypothetical protein